MINTPQPSGKAVTGQIRDDAHERALDVLLAVDASHGRTVPSPPLHFATSDRRIASGIVSVRTYAPLKHWEIGRDRMSANDGQRRRGSDEVREGQFSKGSNTPAQVKIESPPPPAAPVESVHADPSPGE